MKRIKKQNIFTAVDYNTDSLKVNSRSKNLLHICEEHDLKHHFYNQTRTTPTSIACIDNIFSNMRVQLQNAESLILDVDASDHEALLMSLSSIQNDTSMVSSYSGTRFKRQFTNENLMNSRNILQQ